MPHDASPRTTARHQEEAGLLATQNQETTYESTDQAVGERPAGLRAFKSYPPQALFIFGNEACERYSFYGMRSILIIFMTSQLRLQDYVAKAIFHLFTSGCYLTPLAGAYLADRYLGKYRCILYLSSVYCMGHVILAVWESRLGTYIGLTAIASGAGGIKPCVSSFMGDQFPSERHYLLKGAFSAFYWTINCGSLAATLSIPIIYNKGGSSWAFGVPGIAMGVATLIFWSGHRFYVDLPPTGPSSKPGVLKILTFTALQWRPGRDKGRCWEAARQRFSAEDVDNAASMVAMAKLVILIAAFWSLFDQTSSTWVLQARDMDLNVGDFHVEPSQMQAINPLLVMLFIPVAQYFVYPAVGMLGVNVTPLRCMSAGMVLAGLAFVIIAVIQSMLDAGKKLSVLWQLPAYIVLTFSELLVSVTGLEFAYTQAPPSMKASVMSFWLLTTFGGNLLDAVVSAMNVFEGAWFFAFFAALMFCTAAVFSWIALSYQVRDFASGEPNLLSRTTKRRLSDGSIDHIDADASHIALVSQR